MGKKQKKITGKTIELRICKGRTKQRNKNKVFTWNVRIMKTEKMDKDR